MKRGEIWWAYLAGAEGSEQAGRRPVVVLHRDSALADTAVVLVAPITRVERAWPSHVPVEPTESGLPTRSVVMCEQIRALDRRRLRKGPVGRLTSDAQERVDGAARYVLGL